MLADAPDHVNLDEHAQALAGADILQPTRQRVQAQVDARDTLDRHGSLEHQPGLGHHPPGVAEPGHHQSLAALDDGRAGGDGGDGDQQSRERETRWPRPRVRRDRLRPMLVLAVLVVVVAVVMVVEHG